MDNKKAYTLGALLAGEHYKIRKKISVWILLALPAIYTILLVIGAYLNENEGMVLDSVNRWLGLYRGVSYFLIIIPVLITTVCCYIYDMEHKNGAIQLLATLPYPKENLFFVKIIIISEITITSVVLLSVTFYVCGIIASGTYSPFMIPLLAKNTALNIIAALAIAYFQYALCLLTKNTTLVYIVSAILSISFIFYYAGNTFWLVGSAYIKNNLDFSVTSTLDFGKMDYFSILYIILSLGTGYWLSKKNRFS